MNGMTAEEFEERAVRAAERIRRTYEFRGATPALTVEQARTAGPLIAELARLVVDRWRETKGDMPQPLSIAVMELRYAIVRAAQNERATCETTETSLPSS